MIIHSRKYLETYRKSLRNNTTPAERILWKHLKNKQLDGKRFLRQHSILNYIVDFYCPSEKLIIELDGEVHFNEEALVYDAKRTKDLEGLGFAVIRFENKMVFDLLPSVLTDIKSYFIST
ncbi:endonuclease domain-containing protein [Dokdonia ponticola]|uniref:Endonuclease domain-containing protein n=1 Tax=Dokdonia ponticola TaxID=2041041 RepID=A0ABV9HZJ1_9FLAO